MTAAEGRKIEQNEFLNWFLDDINKEFGTNFSLAQKENGYYYISDRESGRIVDCDTNCPEKVDDIFTVMRFALRAKEEQA